MQARRNLVLTLLDSGRVNEARATLEEAMRATGAVPAYRDLAAQLGASRAGF